MGAMGGCLCGDRQTVLDRVDELVRSAVSAGKPHPGRPAHGNVQTLRPCEGGGQAARDRERGITEDDMRFVQHRRSGRPWEASGCAKTGVSE